MTCHDDTASHYEKLLKWRSAIMAGLAITLLIGIMSSVLIGSIAIPITEALDAIISSLAHRPPGDESSEVVRMIVVNLRLPRVLLAVLTGMCLGISGTSMQAVLKNPLADPFLLGISAGASFGAALAIVLGSAFARVIGATFLEPYITVISAFSFGLLTMSMVYGAAQLRGGGSETLILAGVAISYIFTAGLSLMNYISSHEQLREVTFWLLGGFNGAKWETIALLLPIIAVGVAFLLKYSWDLNSLSAGDETAANLGVDVPKLRRNCAIVSSLMASIVVAFSGIIGFIGLVSPHICRMIIGNDHRYLIPCSGLLGAVLLLISDTIARTALSPSELPVGIVTSVIGAPFFLSILLRRSRGDLV